MAVNTCAICGAPMNRFTCAECRGSGECAPLWDDDDDTACEECGGLGVVERCPDVWCDSHGVCWHEPRPEA